MYKYSAIKEMYYGNRGQQDTIKIAKEDRKILDVIIECEEVLRNRLDKTPELLNTFIKFDNAVSELKVVELENYYREGFRFGFLIAMDVLGIND